MNDSREDYLRTIYSLYEGLDEKGFGIRSVDIAKNLNITRPSVSAMIKKLSDEGFLKIKKYSKVHMTKKGLSTAKRLTRKKRLVEVFLVEKLGHELKDVEDEVHVLEHAFSDNTIDRLDRYLNNPKKCPHGKQIPLN